MKNYLKKTLNNMGKFCAKKPVRVYKVANA